MSLARVSSRPWTCIEITLQSSIPNISRHIAKPLPRAIRSTSMSAVATREVPTRFSVTFCLAGNQRQLVLPVAKETEARLGRSTVFYDTWYEHWIADSDVDQLLQRLYRDRSELSVVCISGMPRISAWNLAEYRAIRATIMSLPPSGHRRILPLRVGDGTPEDFRVNGILPDIRTWKARDSADLIIGRLNLLRRPADEELSKSTTSGQFDISIVESTKKTPSAFHKLKVGAIFISYRRTDQAAFAGRLYDRLAARFGNDQVFMDVDSIEPGLDFLEVLEHRLERCVVLIAVIGKDWLPATDAVGARRLDDPNDFVRLEIESALVRDIRLIPILVDGAQMPRRPELPESIALLSRRNAYSMSNARFGLDVLELLSTLSSVLES